MRPLHAIIDLPAFGSSLRVRRMCALTRINDQRCERHDHDAVAKIMTVQAPPQAGSSLRFGGRFGPQAAGRHVADEETVPLVRALLETTAVTACGVKGSSEVVKHVIRLRPRGTQCRRYAAWQATHCCMTVPSAASAGRTSLLTLPVCASTANRLAARCICVPISCIPCGMKGAMCEAP